MQAVKWMHTVRLGVLAGLVLVSNGVSAQTPPSSGGAQIQGPGQVVVAGTVPDEATRIAVITRLRELYGAERVVDQLSLGSVVAPPQWSQHVQKLLSPSLKQVSHGQLSVQGQTVDLKGEVGNEAVRQQLASEMAQSLNPTYTVRNGLRVAVQEQAVVDQALANRIRLHTSDGLQGLTGPDHVYDLILCNPPYVNSASMAALPAEYQAEPALALAGGDDGMDFIRSLLHDAPSRMREHAVLVLEIGNERDYFEAAFPTLEVVWLETSAGYDQVLLVTREALAMWQQH